MMKQKTQHLVKKPNIAEDVDETFLLPSLRRTLVAGQTGMFEIAEDNETNEENGAIDSDGDQDDSDSSIQGTNHSEGRLYTAGYITRKVNKKFPNDQSKKQPIPSKWIALKSRGYLTYPEASFLKRMKMYDEAFQAFHGSSISSEVDPIKKLVQIIMPQKCTRKRKYEVELYVKIRFHMRIKELNLQVKKTKEERKRSRQQKQINQFIN